MHPPSRRPAPAMMILTQTRAMICRPTTPLVGGPADIHPPLRDVHPPLRPPPPPPRSFRFFYIENLHTCSVGSGQRDQPEHQASADWPGSHHRPGTLTLLAVLRCPRLALDDPRS